MWRKCRHNIRNNWAFWALANWVKSWESRNYYKAAVTLVVPREIRSILRLGRNHMICLIVDCFTSTTKKLSIQKWAWISMKSGCDPTISWCPSGIIRFLVPIYVFCRYYDETYSVILVYEVIQAKFRASLEPLWAEKLPRNVQ